MKTPHKSQRVAHAFLPGSGQAEDSSAFGSLEGSARWPASAGQPCADLSRSQAEPSQPQLTAPSKETASGHCLWFGGARAQPG